MPSDPREGPSASPTSRASSLPRSIFVHDDDPHRDARAAVDAVLSDGFMGAISILLVPIIVLPFFVHFSTPIAGALQAGDLTIILIFVVEYFSKLYLAVDRRAFVRSPWHLLDLAVIVLSAASYLPLLGLHGSASAILLLRLLRLPRAFAVTGRAASARSSSETEAPPPPPTPEEILRQLDPSHLDAPRRLTWPELEQHLATPEPEWIDLSRFHDAALARLSAALGVPAQHFRAGQLDDLWPHVGRLEDTVFLYLQSGEARYPTTTREFYTIARRGAVVILHGPKVISVTPEGLDPFERVAEALRGPAPSGTTFRGRVVEGLLQATLEDYRELLSEVALEVTQVGRTPRSRLPKDFLPRVYELQKAISRVASNLGHFRELLGRFASGRIALEEEAAAVQERFEALADEASYLADLASEATESVGTIVDVYVNQSSYDTNRILKVLAVITAVTLIPATLGSVLGIDGPYDFVFWQVSLVIVFGMVFTTYVFLKLGWLRA